MPVQTPEDITESEETENRIDCFRGPIRVKITEFVPSNSQNEFG